MNNPENKKKVGFAVVAILIATVILVWSIKQSNEPSLPTAPAPAGANPTLRAPDEPELPIKP